MTDRSADSTQFSQESYEENPNDTKPKKMSGDKGGRRTGKRGRRPSKVDVKVKLEKSRQSARECRARKKLRYQYLEELVSNREKAVLGLREELEQVKRWCREVDDGSVSEELRNKLGDLEAQSLTDQSQASPE